MTRSLIAISFFTVGVVSSVALSLGKRRSRHEAPVTETCAREHEEIEALSAETRRLSTSLARSELRRNARAVRRGSPETALAADAATNGATGLLEETPTQTGHSIENHAPAKAADDQGLARVDDMQAHEPADVRWAAEAEGRLRQLGSQLASSATIEQVRCTSTLCKVELVHSGEDIPAARLGSFMSGAQELLPQVTVYPDRLNHKTTLVFGRAGATSPEASGGAS